MVSTFTTARNLEKPAAGDQIGTWGTASVNPNMDVIDAGMGQTATLSAAAGSAVLAAAQYRCSQITFNSTLLASITITFPTSFTGPYTIYHGATGSSAFTITLATTVAGGQAICCKPGEPFDIFNDGTNIRFRGLGHIGSLWEYVGSSVPNWVSGCTVPPYLNCDGTAFSSATYPQLAALIGTTLPDPRGRVRATLNQGTGRLTSSAGVDGNTNFASGGVQTILSSAHIPPVPITDPGHTHGLSNANLITSSAATINQTTGGAMWGVQTITVNSAFTGISAGSSNSTTFTNVQPTVAIGITMVRAA